MKKKNILLGILLSSASVALLASCGTKKPVNTSTDPVTSTPVVTTTDGPVTSTPVTDPVTSIPVTDPVTSTPVTDPVTSTPTTDPITTVVEREVSEDVFYNYFGSYEDSFSKLNIKFNYIDDDLFDYYEGTIEIADNMALDTYSENGSDVKEKVFYNYLDYDNGENEIGIEEIGYNGSKWDAVKQSYSLDYNDARRYVYIPYFDYVDFTYDETSGSYVCDAINYVGYKFEQVSIQFEDDKLVSFSYTYSETSYSTQISCEVVEENTVTVENYGINKITPAVFSSYFNTNGLDGLNLTIDYNSTGSDLFTGTLKIANDTIYDEYDDNGKYFAVIQDFDTSEEEFILLEAYGDSEGFGFLRSGTKNVYELAEYIFLMNFGFSSEIYHDVTNRYERYDDVKIAGKTYSNIYVEFYDDKLVSFGYTSQTSNGPAILTCNVYDVGETEIESPFPGLVSKETFNDYFGLTPEGLEKLNITLNYSAKSSVVNYEGTIEYADGLRLDTYVKNNTNNIIELFYITSISDSVKYDYYVYSNSWSQKYTETNSFDYFMANVMCMPIIDFSELTYNSETGAYEAESIHVSDMLGDITDISIKFNNNKLVSYECTYKWYGNVTTFEITVSNIGTTVVVDPRTE